jgi:N-acetylglucosamine kinase-like BadF-type ATPase
MVRLFTTGLALAGLVLAHAHSNDSLANAIYKDASQSVDARVENLVSLMTLEEKMAQLMQGILFSNTPPRSRTDIVLQAISQTGSTQLRENTTKQVWSSTLQTAVECSMSVTPSLGIG